MQNECIIVCHSHNIGEITKKSAALMLMFLIFFLINYKEEQKNTPNCVKTLQIVLKYSTLC